MGALSIPPARRNVSEFTHVRLPYAQPAAAERYIAMLSALW